MLFRSIERVVRTVLSASIVSCLLWDVHFQIGYGRYAFFVMIRRSPERGGWSGGSRARPRSLPKAMDGWSPQDGAEKGSAAHGSARVAGRPWAAEIHRTHFLRIIFGEEEKNERALMVEKNRSKRFAACSDVQ